MTSHTKPHKCAQCYKSFGSTGDLKRHHITHSGEMLHKCAECNKLFGTSRDLKRHLSLIVESSRTDVLNTTYHSTGLEI